MAVAVSSDSGDREERGESEVELDEAPSHPCTCLHMVQDGSAVDQEK